LYSTERKKGPISDTQHTLDSKAFAERLNAALLITSVFVESQRKNKVIRE